jgi:hypothetical protein
MHDPDCKIHHVQSGTVFDPYRLRESSEVFARHCEKHPGEPYQIKSDVDPETVLHFLSQFRDNYSEIDLDYSLGMFALCEEFRVEPFASRIAGKVFRVDPSQLVFLMERCLDCPIGLSALENQLRQHISDYYSNEVL